MSGSNHRSLWQTITNFQHLDDLLQDIVKQTACDPEDSYFKTAVRFGLEKLTTYWKMLIIDPTPSFYTIATILYPKLCLAWFQDY